MTLKVMTWNLENLFRNGSKCGPRTQAIYDAKLDGLARVITEQAPDALGQEVGDPKALDDLETCSMGPGTASVQHSDKRRPQSGLGPRKELAMTVRFASFNVENLFARPNALNLMTWKEGRQSLPVGVRNSDQVLDLRLRNATAQACQQLLGATDAGIRASVPLPLGADCP